MLTLQLQITTPLILFKALGSVKCLVGTSIYMFNIQFKDAFVLLAQIAQQAAMSHGQW
jgi:hypothetical protein